MGGEEFLLTHCKVREELCLVHEAYQYFRGKSHARLEERREDTGEEAVGLADKVAHCDIACGV